MLENSFEQNVLRNLKFKYSCTQMLLLTSGCCQITVGSGVGVSVQPD